MGTENSNCQDLRIGGRVDYKGVHRVLGGDENTLYLDCGGSLPLNTYVQTYRT
jgi:hypothetical protein